MADRRPCKLCGADIRWTKSALAGVMPLDANPVRNPDQEGLYAVVNDEAVSVGSMPPQHAAMLEGPLYLCHVRTCKPPEKKRKHA